MHYCMGKLVGWGLIKTEATACSVCGMEKNHKTNDGCCKDETRFIKNTTDQKITDTSIQLMQLASVGLPPSLIEAPLVHITSVTTENLYQVTSRSSGTAVYLLNCVFRI